MILVLDEARHEGAIDTKQAALAALTPRQLEVLEMISMGLTNAEVAARMHLTIHAIKFHLAAIYRLLGVGSRTEAAVTYLRSLNGDLTARAQAD